MALSCGILFALHEEDIVSDKSCQPTELEHLCAAHKHDSIHVQLERWSVDFIEDYL